MAVLKESVKRLLAGALCCAALCGLAGCGGNADPAPTESATPKVYYATEGVTEVEDPDALQKAVDAMVEKAKDPGVALEYKNDASSSDGQNFTCYLANSASNTYDMFIAIYADPELTDQIYLSGLLRPGTAFSTLTLDRALDPGVHTVYVVHTQVEEDLETIHAQVVITMDFAVG